MSVTKFAYLQELLEPKARVDIDGLPLNTEGYEKAKNIIKEEYAKTSEVVNAYVNNILQLPTVTSADPSKVNSFYKTLLFNVQSLETLVRGQENWQDWDLVRLAQALKKWRDVNPATEGNNVESMTTPSKCPENKSRFFHAESMDKRRCVYCDDASHYQTSCS